MKTIISNLLIGLLCLSHINIYAQWNSMYIGTCQLFSGIHCPTDNTCYIVGHYGYVAKSIDQGGTWTELASPTIKNITDCFFTDSITGYACGQDGLLLKTINGGISWDTLNTPDSFSNFFWSIKFTNSLTGYVAGAYGAFYKTTNAGASWTKINISNAGSLGNLQFVNDSVGYMSNGGGYNKKTTNAGLFWQNLNITGFSSNTTALHFPNSNYGYAISGAGECSRTKDGGATWNIISYVTSIDSNDVVWDCFFVDSIKGYCVTNKGIIYSTNDGGQHWGLSAWPTSNILSRIYFQNKNTGYALGWFNSSFKYGTIAGTEELFNNNFNIYPNPTTNHLNITTTIPQNQPIHYQIINTLGEAVMKGSSNENEFSADVSVLSSGVYFISLHSESGRAVKRFVRE